MKKILGKNPAGEWLTKRIEFNLTIGRISETRWIVAAAAAELASLLPHDRNPAGILNLPAQIYHFHLLSLLHTLVHPEVSFHSTYKH